jgi:hypothetical protein
VFAPGDWGAIVNGGAWLTVDGTRVDLIYRDLAQVRHWTAEAQAGRFEIQREVGYVAGIATYILAGELALGRVLAGDLPRPAFPDRLRETAPAAWSRLAAGALQFAVVHAGRGDRVACLANLTQATLATAQARMAAAGEWVLNEKRLVARAGLDHIQTRLAGPGHDLAALVASVGGLLDLHDSVWPGD